MKKGFTLVELLAVITVFAIIVVLILPRVAKHIDDSKEDLYKVQIDSIENATKDYLLSEKGKADRNRAQEKTIYIELAKLQEYDFLEKEKIKNPLDGEIMNGVIRVTYRNNTFDFEYLEMSVTEAEEHDFTVERYILDKADIKTSASTEDGLYSSKINYPGDMDATGSAKNMYYYRGNNPNNYIQLLMAPGSSNAEMWNIVSIDTTNKVMKLVRTGKKSKTIWSERDDAANILLSEDSLKMYQYLNTTVFNSFSDSLKKNLKTPKWMLGEVDSTSSTLDLVMGDEALKQEVRGTAISLLSVSDYMNASLASSCRTTNFDAQCVATNWLTNLVVKDDSNIEVGYYLRNTVKGQQKVWSITSSGLTMANVTSSLYVYPVIYVPTTLVLDSSMNDTGVAPIGSVSNPYVLKMY